MIDTTPAHIRFAAARFLDPVLLCLEDDLKKHFLGNDFQDICTIAARMEGEPTFLATATCDLDRRRQNVREWRGRVAVMLLGNSMPFADYYGELSPEMQRSIREGEVEFCELDHLIREDMEERAEAARIERNLSKSRLNQAMFEAMADSSGEWDGERHVPGFLVILEDGTFGLFCRRANGMEFGRASGMRFYAAPIDKAHALIRPGS